MFYSVETPLPGTLNPCFLRPQNLSVEQLQCEPFIYRGDDMLIGYGRVSTRDQNLKLQTDALKAAGCEKVFVEKASGAKADRPQLAKALAFMREGDTLVVWKLDRLARSMRQLVNTIGDMRENGIGFKSLTENIDTTSAGGKLVFGIFSSIAEFERELIRERVMAGMEASDKKGGRPALITDAMRKAIEKQLRAGVPVAAAAEKEGLSRDTLYKAIKSGRLARPA
jgi:DNA invertase Pin-like site-specific DNA recombinase